MFNYILGIGLKHRFAVDQVSVLPDHLHLLTEGVPTISVESYVHVLQENIHYWMNKYYYGVLKESNAWDVWPPTYYAGTVGEYTTAQMKRFLASRADR